MAQETIEFIKEHGIQSLETLGISARRHDGLVCLTYSQIDSPKTHSIVKECRGLILHEDSLTVVCRPFDRFFNYGEVGTAKLAEEYMSFIPKEDGTLIKLYFWKNQWNIATKGTVIADAKVSTTYGSQKDFTFEQLCHRALGIAEWSKNEQLSENRLRVTKLMEEYNLRQRYTYLLELTSPECPIITPYTKTELCYLAARNNVSGEYLPLSDEDIPAIFSYAEEVIDTPKNIITQASKLRGMKEGFVGYSLATGEPLIKVKSPLYVEAHHMEASKDVNPKRIYTVILLGEADEYLTYFPDAKKLFEPRQEFVSQLYRELCQKYDSIKHLENQKEFALEAVKSPLSQFLFMARKENLEISQVWNRQNCQDLAFRLAQIEPTIND
jgi:hypothetical protein